MFAADTEDGRFEIVETFLGHRRRPLAGRAADRITFIDRHEMTRLGDTFQTPGLRPTVSRCANR